VEEEEKNNKRMDQNSGKHMRKQILEKEREGEKEREMNHFPHPLDPHPVP